VCEKGLPEDFDELSELCGVGPKVANCISLFGMQDYASFPIDVWVIKVMHELYGLPEKDKKGMAAFARKKFGDLGGFAQQYLFYYMRDRS
jgi:N-glycosylase/DNA lyase